MTYVHRRLTAAEHIFTAYRTVILVLVLQTGVVIVYTYGDAHGTLGTVLVVLLSPHAAEAAFGTMKGMFAEGHPYVALEKSERLNWKTQIMISHIKAGLLWNSDMRQISRRN